MSKKYRVRCTLLEGKYHNPDITEVYNLEDASECYPTGRGEFRIGQYLNEDEFYLQEMSSDSGGNYLMAFRKK